jgi:hypothetical protein
MIYVYDDMRGETVERRSFQYRYDKRQLLCVWRMTLYAWIKR